MKYLSILFFFFTLTCGAQTSESKKVDQLHLKKFQWFTGKKYDSINWVLDESVQYIHSNGWIQTKSDVIADMKSGKLNYTSITIDKSSVKLYDNGSAIVTGTGTFVGTLPDGSPFNLRLLYTEVYIKIKKQWKLVNRLSTKLVN
jgi:hypothetical protein